MEINPAKTLLAHDHDKTTKITTGLEEK